MSLGKKIAAILGVLCLLGIAIPAIGVGVAYTMVTVPQPNQLVNNQVTTIWAADDTTELARIVPPEGNRQEVPLAEVPVSLQQAVVAAEDREFYTNPGFSISGFARAVRGQITGDTSAGGGSTITQQYVKNAVVGNENSYKRKLKELIYSAKMANEWSKDQVLEAYLNTIYFGRSSWGVSAASWSYFGKPVGVLTLAESAVLAASIQSPSLLDPWEDRAAAEARWNYVLDGMVTTGAITQEERDAQVYPSVIDPATLTNYSYAEGTNGLIRTRVLAELNDLGISESDVQTKGLRIVTTIDPVAQNAAVEAVHNNLASLNEDVRAAVVSIEPTTGAVRAYYGGEDPNGWDYANAGLQTGSTFKIFGLAAALQQGIPLSKGYSSAPFTIGDVTVTNVEGDECGFCSIAEALKRSHNTSFMRLVDDLNNGPQDVADMAHALGVARTLPGIGDTLRENGGTPYNGIVLGQYQTRPFDMAVALGTLADQGVWHKPHFVERVTDSDGAVIYSHAPDEGERRVSANVADSVMQAMAPIAAYSNGNVLAGGRPSAAKTGTTQLGETGQNKDAWMIGATPQLATAVWLGTDDNQPLTNSWGGLMYGSGTPARIWKATMDGALVNADWEEFPTPQNLGNFSSYTGGYTGGYYYGGGGDGGGAATGDAGGDGTGAGDGAAGGFTDGGGEGYVPPPVEAPAPAPPAPPADLEILPGIVIPGALLPR